MTVFNRRHLLAGSACLGVISIVGLKPRQARAQAPTHPRPALEIYGALPFVQDTALSPDGNRLAIVTNQGETKLLSDYNLVTGDIKEGGLGDLKIRGVFWGSNDHIIVTHTVTRNLDGFGRGEFGMAQSINLQTRKTSLFYSEMDDFYQIYTGDMFRIKVDGEYRVTASNMMIQGRDQYIYLYSFDLNTNKETFMDKREQQPDWLLSPEGRPIALSQYNRGSTTWTLSLPQGTGWKPVYSQKEAIDTPSLICAGPDGTSAIIYIDSGDKAGDYYEVKSDGSISDRLGPKGFSRGVLTHPETRRLSGFAHYDDWVSYEYSDPNLKALAKGIIDAFEGYRIRLVEFDEKLTKVLIYCEGSDDAGSYYVVDFKSGDSKLVGQNYPDIPAEWVTEKNRITYKAADGLEIGAFLTLPPFKEAKNLPLVVVPHGGPQSRDDLGFDWMGQALASRGYAVLQPNFRGSSGLGTSFIEAGYGEWGKKMQTDLSDGVRHLAKMGIIDAKRVAIFGASYGGYAALAGAALDTGVYKCAVSVAGVSDLKAKMENNKIQSGSQSPTVRYWKRYMGDQAGWDQVSPAKQADKINIPVMLIHGDADTVVPIEQSRLMESALKAAGKLYEFVLLEKEDHWLSRSVTRTRMLTAAVGFIEKHNPA